MLVVPVAVTVAVMVSMAAVTAAAAAALTRRTDGVAAMAAASVAAAAAAAAAAVPPPWSQSSPTASGRDDSGGPLRFPDGVARLSDLVAETSARLAALSLAPSTSATDAAAAAAGAAGAVAPLPAAAARIYGGFATGNDKTVAPVMARLLSAGPGGTPRLRCAGTLISRSSVLTAAACGVRPGDVLGIASERLGGGFFFPISRVVVHPDWKPSSAGDGAPTPRPTRLGPGPPGAPGLGAPVGGDAKRGSGDSNGSRGSNSSSAVISERQMTETPLLDVALSTSSGPPQVGLARATAANLAVVRFMLPAYVDWRVARAANFRSAPLVVGLGEGGNSGVVVANADGGASGREEGGTNGTARVGRDGGGDDSNNSAPVERSGGGGANGTVPGGPGGSDGANGTRPVGRGGGGGANNIEPGAPGSGGGGDGGGGSGDALFDIVGAIAGWGAVAVSRDVTPQLVDSLRATTIHRWNDADCEAAFAADGGTRPYDTFYVGGPFGIIGRGERFVISAVSAGFFESDRFRCEPRGPSYFTSLTPHLAWLKSAVAPEKVTLYEGLQ
ncbi:hypothetical protein MMPV_007162 [Pyropia vietnamensis]